MSRRGVLALIAIGVAVAAIGHVAVAAEKPKDKVTTFNVPTSGKIIDVIYSGEFDEWWVKCREGDNIVVYTYDRRSKSWGRVSFVPKAPQETARKSGKPESGAKPVPIVSEGREPQEGISEVPKPSLIQKPESKPPSPSASRTMTILKKGDSCFVTSLQGKE
jgi:hypothetical protein